MTDDSRLIAARNIARKAQDLAEAHHLRPLPEIYAVLFHHVQGYNPELSEALLPALKLPMDDREDAVMRCYISHLSDQTSREGLLQLHSALVSELGATTRSLTQGLSSNSQMVEDMRQALRELAGSMTKADVQTVCKDMTRSTRNHTGATQQVVEELEKTRAQLEVIEQELVEMRIRASRDPLTNLPNRRYLEEHLKKLLDDQVPLSLALIDLDDLKTINDTRGHLFGDNILRGVGQVLKDCTKGRDFAARIGGDEFALVMPRTPLNGAIHLCEQIRQAFSDILWISDADNSEVGSFTLSIGVSTVRENEGFVELFQRADSALYKAKGEGRDTVVGL